MREGRHNCQIWSVEIAADNSSHIELIAAFYYRNIQTTFSEKAT
jgi:hypothetical protein